jgi:hypothetical protein
MTETQGVDRRNSMLYIERVISFFPTSREFTGEDIE